VSWFAPACFSLSAALSSCGGATGTGSAVPSSSSAPAPAATPIPPAAPGELRWAGDEDSAYALARAEHKGVLVDFHAAWCVPCLDLERAMNETAVAPEIMAHFIPVKLDVTEYSEANRQYMERYQTNQTLPNLIFMTGDGVVLDRVTTSISSDELLRDHVRPAIVALTSQRSR
jgi:thiol:disulfide interchange protein DsbD